MNDEEATNSDEEIELRKQLLNDMSKVDARYVLFYLGTTRRIDTLTLTLQFSQS